MKNTGKRKFLLPALLILAAVIFAGACGKKTEPVSASVFQSSLSVYESDKTSATVNGEDSEPNEASAPDLSQVYNTGSQFRNKNRLQEHYDKHVIDQEEFGDITIEEYLYRAQCLVDTPGTQVLTKVRDGDHYFYDPDTNEFAVVSDDGYIRTFFKPSAGRSYYDRQ